MTKQKLELKKTDWRKRSEAPTAANMCRWLAYFWEKYAMKPTWINYF